MNEAIEKLRESIDTFEAGYAETERIARRESASVVLICAGILLASIGWLLLP